MALARIEKPWGYELVLERSPLWMIKALVIHPGKRLSLQRHARKTEAIYVEKGPLLLQVTDAPHIVPVRRVMYPGDTAMIWSGTIHRFCAFESQVRLIEVADTLPEGEEDIERFEDDHGRA